ncbi:MAG: hypothetical protein HY422_03615 [Candidatus Komeilibacteria bacterium]|nr:hypothetical protein [Candidatus Komeilibacteria bacterium]
MNSISLEFHYGTRRSIVKALEGLFPALRKFHDREYHGGYMNIAERSTGAPLLIMGVGNVPLERISRHLNFSIEKAMRLGANPKHESSAQSRNSDKDQYSGAIRARDLIFSFSGFPEDLDEAAMLGIAVYVSQLLPAEAKRIAALSQNDKLLPVLNKFTRM